MVQIIKMTHEKLSKIQNDFIHFKGEKYSELGQDALALILYDYKNTGYFVEFGAFNGKSYSNTYLLEKQYGWNGIVAEPGRIFLNELRNNRTCKIDTRAVTDMSGMFLNFKETNDHLGLSGIIDHVYNSNDMHVNTRKNSEGSIYLVETVSLNDLLREHNAPKCINYISMDTEGSEALILNAFDFTKYEVGLFTVEHNYVISNRNRIYDILTENNYVRILENYSKYDDWYILEKFIK